MIRNTTLTLLLAACSNPPPIPEPTKPAEYKIYCRIDTPKDCEDAKTKVCQGTFKVTSDTQDPVLDPAVNPALDPALDPVTNRHEVIGECIK